MPTVRSGWNSDYAHKKMDVELGEADLRRILYQAGIPADISERLPVEVAEELLYLAAEDYALVTQARYHKDMAEDLAVKIKELRAKKKDLLDKVRAKYTDV